MTNTQNKSNSFLIHSLRLLIIISFMLILSAYSKITVYAKEYKSGACGNNLTYTITGDNDENLTLSINGTGDMWDYYYGSAAGTDSGWYSYRSQIKTIIISEGVTSIGTGAFNCYDDFYGNKGRGWGYSASVSFPSTLESIDDYAFREADIYGNLIIPNGVTRIGEEAFIDCKDLNGYISLPDSLSSLGYKAFCNVSKLTGNLRLSANLSQIPGYAFYGCESISSVTFGSKVTSIGEYAFSNCHGITNIVLPSSLQTIDQYAFYDSGLTGTIEIPATVNLIKSNAFTRTSLSVIKFLGNAPTENEDAFGGYGVSILYNKNASGFSWPRWHGYNSEFERIKVTGVKVTPTKETIFEGESVKITATIEPSNADIKDVKWTIDGDEITSDSNEFTYQFNNAGTYRIQAITLDGSFMATSTITVEEYVPVDVTGITVSPTKKTIYLGETAKITATISPSNADNKSVVWIINDKYASTTSNVLSYKPKSVGTYEIIAQSADQGYEAYCILTVKKKDDSSATKTGDKITYKSAVYQITKLPSGSKNGEAKLVSVVNNATKITVPASFKHSGKTYKITAIAAGACKNNKKITSFTIGANVTSIGDSAFLNCSKLTSAKIPDKVKTIGKNAYRNCSAMTSASIGKNVTTINDNAFFGCKKAKKWTVKTSRLKKMGKNSLKNTPKNATCDVPDSKIKSYYTMFKKAGANKSIKVK